MNKQKLNSITDEEKVEGVNVTLKRATIVSTPLAEDMATDIKPATVIDAASSVDVMEDTYLEEEKLIYSPKSKAKKASRKWFTLLAVAIVAASVAELSIFIIEVTRNSDWLGAIWLGIFAVLGLFLAGIAVSEYKGLKQLKAQNKLREASVNMVDTPAMGLAEPHCIKLARQLPTNYQPLIGDWQNSVDETHNDREILSLFEHKVMAPIDKLAIKQVSSNASAAGVMIAVSPFALLDMMIVFWRNIRMMDQVSEIYGLHLGYWARIKLIRKVFHTMLYAGAAEILSDAGNYALGTGITGKLSTRVAQGLGAGILTTRIGLKAIEECRPMPWVVEKRPGISSITKQLLAELTQKVG